MPVSQYPIMVHIDDTTWGEIVIDGHTHYADVIVWWDGLITPRQKEHIFTLAEFMSLLVKKPDHVVFGNGQQGTNMIDEKVPELAEHLNIHFYVEKTKQASYVFNGLVQSGERVVVVLHVND